MAIEFLCGSCSSRLKAPDNSAGKRVKCPKCETVQTIPGTPSAPMATPPGQGRPKPNPTATAPQASAGVKKPAAAAPAKPAKPAHVGPIAPLESPSPFGDLGNFFEEELTAAPVKAPKQPWETETPEPQPMPAVRDDSSSETRERKGSKAGSTLIIPAIFFMILSALAIIIILFDVSIRIYFLAYGEIPFDRILENPRATGYLAGVFIANLIVLIVNIAILRGGLCMITRTNYSLAKTSAIFACIPLCNIFTLPFAIWALIVLAKGPVKSSFRG